jgi:lipoprotein-anchoring transpeptidase ErfK/SrfK
MTLAALAGVGVLAAQAAATAPKVSTNANAKSSTTTHQPGKSPSPGAGSSATTPNPLALPANSGSGQRIVYGEAAKRVWLVSGGSTVARTFQVVPGSVAAPTGTFQVTNRLSTSAGTDGTPIQYVVLFNNARVDRVSTAFGFDAVANVTGLPPAPSGRTGGIRMAQADAQALWNFSNFGTTVVVVS